MTLDDVKKIRADMRPGHHILTDDVVEAIDWLADALREAQAQTVQMREDAARVAEKAQRLRGRDCCEPEERIAKEIRALPAPAARTYDDGVRDAAKIAHKAADGLRGRDCCTPERRFAREIEALLSPAPAVATVAAPRPLHPADCAHDSTPEVSVPHMPDPCGFVSDTNHVACPLPFGHAGWHRTPPVAAPKPGLTKIVNEVGRAPFDAEAALVAAREAARTGLDLNPTVEARQIAHLLHRMLSDALAAGRGAR